MSRNLSNTILADEKFIVYCDLQTYNQMTTLLYDKGYIIQMGETPNHGWSKWGWGMVSAHL